MRKTASLPLPFVARPIAAGTFLRIFLAGELLLSLALQAQGAIPPAALRALQLFLRF